MKLKTINFKILLLVIPLLQINLVNCEKSHLPRIYCEENQPEIYCLLKNINTANPENEEFIPDTENPRSVTHVKITESIVPILTATITENICEMFPDLEEFFISSSSVELIDDDAFIQCPSLKRIHIVENNVKTLPENLFNRNPSLEKILLYKNRIKEVDTNWFSNLNRLTLVDLSYNELTEVDPELFMDLVELEVLGLDNNFLRGFNATELMEYTPKLEQIWLADNEIDFDSEMFNVFEEKGVRMLCQSPSKMYKKCLM